MSSPAIVSFFVPGRARPAGSKRAFLIRRRDARPIVNVVDAADNAAWKADIKRAAIDAFEGDGHQSRPPMTGPLRVSFSFTVTRPRSHFRGGRHAGWLKANAPPLPVVKPDLLKLARCVEDALNGVIWADDRQIVEEELRKVYGDKPGVMVYIWEDYGLREVD